MVGRAASEDECNTGVVCKAGLGTEGWLWPSAFSGAKKKRQPELGDLALQSFSGQNRGIEARRN